MIPYSNIAKAVALRANQLKDAVSADAFNANYQGNLTDALGGLEIPYAALKQSVLASEKRLADLIGKTKNPILRGSLYAKSINVVSGLPIPTVSVGGTPFVGNFGGIFDAATKNPLTEKTKQEVLRRTRNAGEFFKLPAYHFCIEGATLFHTAASVYFEGCAWSDTVQGAAYEANGTSPLPTQIESLWVADVLTNLPQENWFTQEAGVYAQIVLHGEQLMMQGLMPEVTLPNNTAGGEPIKD